MTWIFVYICVVFGHGEFGHDDRGYMYEPHPRDYHYDQGRYHFDRSRYEKHENPPSSKLDRPQPPPRRPSPFRDWPPPPPSPRTERPAPVFDRGNCGHATLIRSRI